MLLLAMVLLAAASFHITFASDNGHQQATELNLFSVYELICDLFLTGNVTKMSLSPHAAAIKKLMSVSYFHSFIVSS